MIPFRPVNIHSYTFKMASIIVKLCKFPMRNKMFSSQWLTTGMSTMTPRCSSCHRYPFFWSATRRFATLKSPRTHYEILGVSPSSTKKEIKTSFYALSKKFHPDINSSEEANDRFVEISSSYTVLMDDAKRREYDMQIGRDRVASGKDGFRYRSKDVNPDDWETFRKGQSAYPGYATHQYYARTRVNYGPKSTSDFSETWKDTRTTWRQYRDERAYARMSERQKSSQSSMAEQEQIKTRMMWRLSVMVILLLVLPDIFM